MAASYRSSLIFLMYDTSLLFMSSPRILERAWSKGSMPPLGANSLTLSRYMYSSSLNSKLPLSLSMLSSGFSNGGKYPVETVSYNDAMAFCQKLSEMTGRTFTLPTEAQWEYAARGGHKASRQQTVFSGSDNLDEVAWYLDNAEESTHEVATLQPNALGLYDMTGNVWEWCRDFWSDDFGSDAVTDPEGPSEGMKHVDRGGSWNKVPSHCRLSFRYGLNPDYKAYNLGFRVVCLP